MFGQDRNQMRQFFLSSWLKFREQQALEPLEALVAGVISDHPEYHAFIESGDDALGKDYSPDDGQTNPFLHMGMHITIREQLQTDRPPGITSTHQQLVMKIGDAHEAEHHMLECLGLVLWESQRSGAMPDEMQYLECVKKLL